MKKFLLLLLVAVPLYAGTTNYFVALPTAAGGGSSVIWSLPQWTNSTYKPYPFWTNAVTGPLNFLKIRIAGVDAFYGYNITNASAAALTPVVQANTIDNVNLMGPGPNVSNICARENGSTGNGTAEVWVSWQEPSQNVGFPR